jgi:hypothetical protein
MAETVLIPPGLTNLVPIIPTEGKVPANPTNQRPWNSAKKNLRLGWWKISAPESAWKCDPACKPQAAFENLTRVRGRQRLVKKHTHSRHHAKSAGARHLSVDFLGGRQQGGLEMSPAFSFPAGGPDLRRHHSLRFTEQEPGIG